MLTPEYLEQCPDRLVTIYEQAERDIIADMARKIREYDYFCSSTEWQAKKLQEMGISRKEILKRLSATTGKTKAELTKLLKEAGVKTLRDDGVKPTQAAIYALNAGLRRTLGTFDNLTRTTAVNGTRQIVEALDRVYAQVTSGAFSQETAIKNAVMELAKNGIETYRYSSRSDYLDVVVRRAVRTGVNQTAASLALSSAEELRTDLVEVTAHDGARPSHARWQGKVYSISGKTEGYEKLSEATGFGTVAGLCGANCRHNFHPFFEGDDPIYTEEELENLNAKRYTYNGEKLTEHEATQHQRYIERQLRRWKRERVGMEAAGLSSERAQAKIKKWDDIQKDFLTQTGLKRQYGRESVPQIGKKALAQFTFKKAPGAGNTTQEKMTVMNAIAHTSKNVREKMRSTTIQIGGAASAYDYQNDIMYIANGAAENEVYHEIGHLIDSKMLDAEKVMKLKKEVFKETELSDIIAKTMYETNGNPVSVLIVRNEKLVSEYQGRIYVEKFEDAFDEFGELRLDKMLEFVSEPYRAYMEEPETFKEKYASFYALLKEVVENEPER